MPTYALTHVTDDKLLADLAALVSADRQTMAIMLAHIAEVDARELFLPAACTSMHVYATRVLHLSEDAAFKRIRAARVARRFPQLFDAVADGRLHLTAVGLLAPHLTDGNVDELVAAATHRSKLEIEMLLARLAPRPDLPTAITPIVPPAEPLCNSQQVPEPVVHDPSHDAPPPRVTPLAPERFALQVTISEATRNKLERARALMRHRNPSGDIAEVLDRALDALLVALEKEKFGATSRPRARRARSEESDPSYVSNEVRRAVHDRDGEQCTFVGENGERCCERGFLEIDHRKPVVLGGRPTVENLRMLCRAHNQYEAQRLLGADFMRAKRNRRKAARVANAGPTAAPVAANPASAAAAPVAANPAIDVTPVPAAVPAAGCSAPAAATVVAPAVPDAQRVDQRELESDLTLALRGLGFTAFEVRRAVAETANMSAEVTLEQRLRAALAVLTRSRSFRCSEGGFDGVGDGWACA